MCLLYWQMLLKEKIQEEERKIQEKLDKEREEKERIMLKQVNS